MAESNLTQATIAYQSYEAALDGESDANDKIQTYLLNKIGSWVTTNANYGLTYVDIKFTDFGTSYKKTVLEWINLSSANSEAEHKTGSTAEDNLWSNLIGKSLTDNGYKWCFRYERDVEEPFGLRVSWLTANAEENTEDTNITTSWDEKGYIILPENKYYLPKADELDDASTANTKETNRALIQALFSSIGAKVINAAHEYKKAVLIPWEELGEPYTIQSLFFKETSQAIDYSSASKLFKRFSYGTSIVDHAYTSATYKTYPVSDFDPVDMGFFNSADWSDEEYTHYNENGFSLHALLTTTLGYDVKYYEVKDLLNNGTSYCGGIGLGWEDNTNELDDLIATIYNNSSDAWDEQNAPTYEWPAETVPMYDDYTEARKKANSSRLQTFINLTTSKMEEAFARGECYISILWSEVDSKYANQVRHSWGNTRNYSGTFQNNFTDTISTTFSGSSKSMADAYSDLMKGNQLTSAIQNDNVKSLYYVWEYIRYKPSKSDDTDGTTKNANGYYTVPNEKSCGVAISLVNGSAANAKATVIENIVELQDAFLKTDKPKT